MNFDAVFTVKKETSKEEFLREVLIELAASSKTPVDVVKAQFGEVQEGVREAIVCTAHVETNYTASVGYDRVETYYVQEKKYDSTTKTYHYENVEKKRTVTDWMPHSGHLVGKKTAGAFNDAASTISDNDTIADVLKSTHSDNIVLKGEAELTSLGLESAKRNCAYFLETEIKYPGDHHKDERKHSSVDVESITCYKLPYYQVEYTYNGKKYTATGFACGNPNIKATLPPNDINVEAETKKQTEVDQKMVKASWIAFGASFALSFIVCFFGFFWLWFLPVAALVAVVVFNNKLTKKFNDIMSSLTTGISIAKKEALEEALRANSYAPLSSKESEDFSARTAADNKRYQSAHGKKKSTFMTKVVLSGIATAILIIASIIGNSVTANKKLHSPDQVDIELVAKSQEYQENVRPYTNGCYFIYLNYEVSGDEIGVSNMSVNTTIYNKKTGEVITTLTANFEEMNLDKGSTKTYTVTVKDNQPQKNNNVEFLTLYDISFEDLEFEHEFDYICFSDGQYYFGEDRY